MTRLNRLAAVAILSIAACHTLNAQVPCPIPPFGTVVVDPAFVLDGQGRNVDSIELWEAPRADSTLLFVTGKDNSLVEVWRYPFDGNELPPLTHPTFGSAKVNGLVVDQERDRLYVATAEPSPGVSVFTLPDLTFEMHFLKPGAGDMGVEPNLTLLKLPSGERRIYLSSEDTVYIHDALNGAWVEQFAPEKGLETMMADSVHQCLYIPDEKDHTGVYVYHPDGTPFLRNGTNRFGQGVFDLDAEGIWLYACRDGSGGDTGAGMIIVSDQIDPRSEFEVFDRESWAHLGTIELEGVNFTDGIRSFQEPLPGYPMGLFLAIDDDRTTAGVGWDVIFGEMNLVRIGTPPAVPAGYVVSPPHPNPFNPSTTIVVDLPRSAGVVLEITDVSGRRVRRIVAGELAAGRHRLRWAGRTDEGYPAAGGVYVYRVTAGPRVATGRMVLVR